MALLINPYRFGGGSPASLFGGSDDGLFVDFQIGQSPMYTDTGGTTAVTSNNDNIRHVKSLAPTTTDDFTNAGATHVYKTGAVPYAQFSGNGAVLASSDFAGWLDGKGGSTFCIASQVVGTGTCVPLWYYGDGTNATFLYITAGLYQFNAKRAGSEIAAIAPSTNYNAWVVVTGVGDLAGGAVKLRINGTQVASSAIAAGNYGTATDNTVSFGAGWTGDNSDFRTASAFAINRVLSAGELDTLENWMKARAGI
jgi:hypothetical protein